MASSEHFEHDAGLKQVQSRVAEEQFPRMSVGVYAATRISSLKPPMNRVSNPFKLIALLNRRQWMFFGVAFFAWTWDAFDFFTVSLTVTELAEDFGKSAADVTWGITLVLMFRSVGAFIFGLASDRYGRKWPFIVNNVLFIVIELGTGFCQTYKQFIAVRALFGVAMGGLYGNAASTALEDCPPEARGIMSGLLQQGYAFGYLLATAFARGLVDTTSHGWRPLFWFGACPPVLIIIFRLCLPETNDFKARQAQRERRGTSSLRGFLRESWVAICEHRLMLAYLVMLMIGFNFLAHGSQDLYPTMLKNQLEFSPNAITVTQVVANLGALTGGTSIGYLSQIFGRRFSILVVCVAGGALLYPYTYVTSKKVMTAAFFEQFCVQGAWGVAPIHLMELTPDSLRTTVVGTAYQLGSLASSASSTIEAKLSERFPLPGVGPGGLARYNYGKVICIFLGAIWGFVILFILVGPEKCGRSMDVMDDEHVEIAHASKDAGSDDLEKATVHAAERV